MQTDAMKQRENMKKPSENIEQCLLELGAAIVPIKGTSMWPLLTEKKCRVQVAAIGQRPLKKGDMVLYRRKDGTCVLHRIMGTGKDDTFDVCGDHQWRLDEKIHKDQILGVAEGFFRNGHYIDEKTWWYRLYKVFWNSSLTFRRLCLGFLRLTGLEKRNLQ